GAVAGDGVDDAIGRNLANDVVAGVRNVKVSLPIERQASRLPECAGSGSHAVAVARGGRRGASAGDGPDRAVRRVVHAYHIVRGIGDIEAAARVHGQPARLSEWR